MILLYDWTVTCIPNWIRDDSRFAHSQWEMVLLCNDVSHWLGASLEPVLLNVLLYCAFLYASFQCQCQSNKIARNKSDWINTRSHSWFILRFHIHTSSVGFYGQRSYASENQINVMKSTSVAIWFCCMLVRSLFHSEFLVIMCHYSS